MRIPVNSCIGCNQDIPIEINGEHHIQISHGGYFKNCAFIEAEMKDWPNTIVLGAFETKRNAYRFAKQNKGCLFWIGQGPHDIWLVVKEKS